jgi:hypothetical protein
MNSDGTSAFACLQSIDPDNPSDTLKEWFAKTPIKTESEQPIDDGGPAFPQPINDMGTLTFDTTGMSLRAWLAGHALCGLVQDPNMTTSERAVDGAIEMADLMIAKLKGPSK